MSTDKNPNLDVGAPADSPCWKEGKEIFLKSLQESSKPPTKSAIDNFLNDNWDLSRTIANCESLQVKADGEYNKKKGGRFVRKLLDGLMMVKSIADPFLEFAPETVSIAWCAISGLITIAATDVENCGVISDACNNIVSIILTCRIYESRYNQNIERTGGSIGDREVESKIMQGIPNIVFLIFDFSWYIKHHLGESRIKRTFKEAFSPKLKDKVQAIGDEYRKVRGIANDAFQERVMDSVEDIRQDISDKLNEIHVVKGTLDLLKLRQDLQAKRKLFRPDETHTRLFRTIFDPVANHSDILCQWLFTDSHYLSWEQTPTPEHDVEKIDTRISGAGSLKVFYIRGKPGFGKSVAMSCVLQRLTKALRTPICYFFFRQGDDATQVALRALESLVGQIIDESWAKSEVELTQLIELLSSVETHQGQDVSETSITLAMDSGSLVGLLGKAVEILNKPVYIVLDALDECVDQESQELVQRILNLVKASDAVKFIFSSRMGMGFEKSLNISTSVANQDETDCIVSDDAIIMTITEQRTSEDMDLYLRQSLGKIMTRRNFGYGKLKGVSDPISSENTALAKVVASIKQKANGMFTYAAMVIAGLEQPSSLTLSQKLRKLPDGMDALYRGRLESMGIEEKKLILLALKWVVWATEKISVVVIAEDFKNIYGSEAIDSDDEVEPPAFDNPEASKGLPGNAIKDPEIAETIYHLKVIGRDFFRIDGETYGIDVVHKSVRDWVENEAAKANDREAMLKAVTPSFVFDASGGIKLSLQLPSTITNNGNGSLGFQSKRESYLDLAIYQLHVLSNPVFQERYMPYDDSLVTSQDDQKPEESLSGKETPQPESLAAAKSGDGQGKVVAESKIEENALKRPSLENVVQHRDSFALSFQKEKREYRYEVHTLIQVLTILGDKNLWPIQDRRGEKWDHFWTKFTEFAQPKNYKRWNIQYNQFQLGRSELDAYKPTLYQGILHVAAKSGLLMIVEYILENGIANVDEEDGNGSTALMVSAMNPELWKILIDHGADTSKVDPVSGETIWQKAWCLLLERCDCGDTQFVKSIEECCGLLIPRESDVNRQLGLAFGNPTALFVATAAGSWPLFDALMKHPQVNVKVKDYQDNTALHLAFQWIEPGSEEARNKMVAALIQAGVDPNAENDSSATPLPYAISYLVEGSVQLLLEGGANPKDDTVGGFSALHWAAARRITIPNNVDHEKALRIFKVILSHDPEIERETPDGTTPLEMAFQSWNWEFVKAIMTEYEKKYGNDLKYLMRRDSYNRNFLHHCAFNLRWGLSIVKEIVLLIPKEQFDELLTDRSTFLGRAGGNLPGVSAKKKNSGGTPLLDAFQEGRVDLAEFYIRAGADINAKSTAHLNCFEEAVIGWYRAKTRLISIGDEEDLETNEEKVERYEACCHLILDSSPELVQSSSPAVLHYLVAKGALDLVKRVMGCGTDYTYADVEGWTVVEWAHAFRQPEALELVANIARSMTGEVKIDRTLRQVPHPTKLVLERRQTPQKALGIELSDEGLRFQVLPQLGPREATGEPRRTFRSYAASMAFDKPIHPMGINYFEVTFLEGDSKLMCIVGFAGELFRLDKSIGIAVEGGDNSYGLFGLNGGLFGNGSLFDRSKLRGSITDGDLSFGKGDTVGCGLDTQQGIIFYTLNGEYAGVAFEGVYGRWYGVITVAMECLGKVNMGGEPFMFKEMNEVLGIGKL
ncbi:hypothetical protein TWF281_006213 [Arthrobotrys megalospora]